MIYFRSIDPARNRFRWYALDLQPDLFGGVNLVHHWGRIGNYGGSRRVEHFADLSAAQTALQAAADRRKKRKYELVISTGVCGNHLRLLSPCRQEHTTRPTPTQASLLPVDD